MELNIFAYTGYKLYKAEITNILGESVDYSTILVRYKGGIVVSVWIRDITGPLFDREENWREVRDKRFKIEDKNFTRNATEEELFDIFL